MSLRKSGNEKTISDLYEHRGEKTAEVTDTRKKHLRFDRHSVKKQEHKLLHNDLRSVQMLQFVGNVNGFYQKNLEGCAGSTTL